MLSPEQKNVVASLTGNVIVDAVAGSGKTTTMLQIARSYPDSRVLLLTYNSKLRHESKERAKDIPNITIHTFHSFAYRYIGKECSTDSGIIDFNKRGEKFQCSEGITEGTGGFIEGGFIEDDNSPTIAPVANAPTAAEAAITTIQIPKYDIVIIDEAQDLTPTYYQLCINILNTMDARICIIGDRYQSIYGYAGADPRYIIFADKMFPSKYPWMRCNMKTSYRITHAMAAFINRQIGSERLVATKDGPPVVYSVGNAHLMANIKESLLHYAPSEIYIIAKSVRSQTIKSIASQVSRFARVYVPNDDLEMLNAELCMGKITFSSFHQSKGLERKCVHVLGYDVNYYKFTDCVAGSFVAPMYVALTRALHRLYVYQDNQPLPFCKPVESRLLRIKPGIAKRVDTRVMPPQIYGATYLTRHIPSETMHRIMACIEIEVVATSGDVIALPVLSRQGNYAEFVADINGKAVTAEFEIWRTGTCSMYEDLRKMKTKSPYRDYKTTKLAPADFTGCGVDTATCGGFSDDVAAPSAPTRFIGMPTAKDTVNTLQMALDSTVRMDQSLYRLRQITDMTWVNSDTLYAMLQRLQRFVNDVDGNGVDGNGVGAATTPCEFEHRLSYMLKTKFNRREVQGAIDIMTADRIIEVKCVAQLKPEHVLQLVIYGTLYHNDPDAQPKRLELYNVCTDEVWRVTCTDYEKLLSYVVCEKEHVKTLPTDEEFIAGIQPYCKVCTD
tara:strand:+ start:9195 stop:11375 length:2181 start_codon:yes stop_codon:yes gene_type:complete